MQKDDFDYAEVYERLVNYSKLKPNALYKVYVHFIPRSWRSPSPSRELMLKHLYRFLMQKVVDTDADRVFMWYYQRMHGGQKMDAKTYLLMRQNLEQVFAALTPPPHSIVYDPDLQSAVQDQDPIQKSHTVYSD